MRNKNPDYLSSIKPLIMGILNVTPDSFSESGLYETAEDAQAHALAMIGDGADIIDIGGESSRPGAEPVSEQEELGRVMPVIEALAGNVTVPLSIDTIKAGVAREALKAGVSIVNDISALRLDPEMVGTVRDYGAQVVLMHMQGTPRTMQKNPTYQNVVEDVFSFLEERIAFAGNHGIPREKIIVDPGIGFGKTLEHNLSLLKHVSRFHDLGCPVLVGASRKGMIGLVTGMPVGSRQFGTAAIVAHCVRERVQIHRVHDVRGMRQVCDMAAAIRDIP